jgi:hypothetical protein
VNCETARGIIQDYLERRLAILDRNEFVRHVNECRACEHELAGYRDVFSYLGGMKPIDPPMGFQNAVISQLKSEGYVHERRRSAVVRGIAAFRGLPRPVKYPAAVAAAIALLYIPLTLVMSNATGAVARATVAFADLFVRARNSFTGTALAKGLGDSVSAYVEVLKTVWGALHAMASSTGGTVGLIAVAAVIAVSAVLLISFVFRKRSSQDAPFCL